MYAEEVRALLEEKGIEIGDRVKIVRKDGKEFVGFLMPRTYYNPDVIVIKLDNGYNIGVAFQEVKEIALVEKSKKREESCEEEVEFGEEKPLVSLLSTGGTIACRVDYRTGGVTPVLTASDLYSLIPELREVARFSLKKIMNIFSENMHVKYYEKLAKEVYSEIKKNSPRGVIITHGTDTMHFSSSALSFALKNLNIPVVFVGAQRSSDRASSDAAVNLISSTLFACSEYAGVYICMHEGLSDDSCAVHLGTRVRKLHSSRRDAFKSVNSSIAARVLWRERRIEVVDEKLLKKREEVEGEVELLGRFSDRVALVKVYPGFDGGIIDYLVDKNYEGLVIEGTGLGHAPEYVFDAIERACKNMVVCMTTQCIFGAVNMHVYSSGRDLLKMGVIPCRMLPETAFVKLSWAIGNFGMEEARKVMNQNICMEIFERIHNL